MQRCNCFGKEFLQAKLNLSYLQKIKRVFKLKNIIPYAKEYLNFEKNKEDLNNIIKDKKQWDKEMILLAQKELESAEEKIYEKETKNFSLPKDQDDEKNAIVEIRAGTGGLEATLFAADLSNVRKKFLQKNGQLK